MSEVHGTRGKSGKDTKRSGLVVLGMHRSGTSAVTGMLRLCGAWVGEEDELTSANIENPQGFWERRDVRKICDELLYAAGADWWKVASLNLESIPHEILSEHRRSFQAVVSELQEHDQWAVKEPRLCLLLPLLRDYLNEAVCVHVFRNPLEVARSLQGRNDFSIAAGLALWEAYNRRALEASRTMPRVTIEYASLMRDPVRAVDKLLTQLAKLGVTRLSLPDESMFQMFIQPQLHRHKASEDDADLYLSPDQRLLWQQIRDETVLSQRPEVGISAAATQLLYDLESAHQSVTIHKDRISELNATLKKRDSELSSTRTQLASTRTQLAGARTELASLRKDLDGYREKLLNRETELASLRKDLDILDRKITTRDAEIRNLRSSTSWRATAPLRALSTACRTGTRAMQRPFKRARRVTTRRFARKKNLSSSTGASSSERSPYAAGVRYANTASVAKLVQRYRQVNDRRVEALSPATLSGNQRRTKISVIAWNMSHNPLGRAYLLADLLRNDYEVEIVSALFPQFGTELWGPLRTCSRVTMKYFAGHNFPKHFFQMEQVAKQIDGDILYVSKPRLPAIELAILAKLHRNRPIVLDIDDYEPSFFRTTGPLTLDEVTRKTRTPDYGRPQGELWTRYCESLVPLFDQVTVSNEELKKKFGGHVLPHVRSQHDFDPDAYPRDAIRSELGFFAEDKVILFAGTLRMHKGGARIVQAVKRLNHVNCKLLIVGTAPDDKTEDLLHNVDKTHVRVIPDVPFHDLPGYLCAGDLVCLLQEPNSTISQFQMPAKFTDALAMGIPVLASDVPPLRNLARVGLVELLGSAPLERKIEDIFSNHAAYRERSQRNREQFLSHYSYGACRSWMKAMLDRLLESPSPTPIEFTDLIDNHRAAFSGSPESRTAPEPCLTVHPSHHALSPADESAVPPFASRERKSRVFVDDKIDIVFFWKQNDTGIYGRRQDMLVKYLAKEDSIHRVFHFDPPINLVRSARDAARTARLSSHSHARLVFFNSLQRRYLRGGWAKVRSDTFVFLAGSHASRLAKWLFSSEDDYLKYLDGVFKQHSVGERRVLFWVCPNDFRFPSIERKFRPDLVVSDVIDDQRAWDIPQERKNLLEANYREVLGRSDLVFANCDSVFRSMEKFASNIHLFPNAAEVLYPHAHKWRKPVELARMSGPVIGYVGNLDIARLDLDILEAVADSEPDWNLVFLGSMHRGREIEKLRRYKNVHFLGVRVYQQALQYIRYFDVGIIPHLDNELTRNMNPLKLYVYLSLHVPVVATPIDNLGDFDEFVQIGHTPEEFVRSVKEWLERDFDKGESARLESLLAVHSWSRRVTDMMSLIKAEFAAVASESTREGEQKG